MQTCEEMLFGNWRLMGIFQFPLIVGISEAGFNYMETSKCSHCTVGRCLVTVYSTGMLSKLFVLPYQESLVSENTQFEENDIYSPCRFAEYSRCL